MDPVLPDWPINDDIYTGFWINRSLGNFRGPTITINLQMWNLMVAFIALFIGATARSLCTLIRFGLHLVCSTSKPSRGFYHQQQAVLRNASLATDAAAQFLKISYVWRHLGQGNRTRMVLLLSVAILTSVSTTAAGFLSSKLLDNSPSEVLINGRSCGALPFGVPPSVAGPVMSYNARKSSEDLLYATQCYRHNKTEDCAKFVHQVLPYSSDINASCPFAPEMCKMAYGNLHLDTGTLDSVYHLGLNRGPRFTLQYRTHCAPLVTKGYTTVDTIENSTRKLILYNYGRSSDGHSNTSVHVAEQDKERHNYKVPVGTYKVTHVDRYDTGFIPQLTQPDAMVSLVFLDASEILYMNKTYDPWFSATTPLSEVVIDGLKDFYITDEPVSVLGCSSQRFLCNPAMPKINCVNSLYPNEEIAAIQTAWPQPEDQHQIYPILAAQYQYGVGKGTSESLYAISGAPTLLARKTMVNNRQHAELPLNHWQSEREYMFTASLAAWQSSLVEYARGSWFGDSSCNADFPCQRICHSQRARSSKYHSFGAWALFLILSLGIITMLVALYVDELFGLLLHHTSLGKNNRLTCGFAEWQAGSTLQLQRIAHENLGLGIWKRTDEAVPVTRADDLLGVFDTKNLRHARLVQPSEEANPVSNGGSVLGAKLRARN